MTRHPLDAVSLAFGLVFSALGLVTLATSTMPFGWFDPRIVLPVAAVAGGLWLLVTGSRRRAARADSETWAADHFGRT